VALDSVGRLLQDYAGAPLLTAAQEVHLATLIQAGRADGATPAQQRAGMLAITSPVERRIYSDLSRNLADLIHVLCIDAEREAA